MLGLVVLVNSFSVCGVEVEKYKPVDKVFPKKETTKELKKARKQKIYEDKSCKKVMGVAGTKESGCYPTRPGVILVTSDSYKNLIPTGHAAIVYNNKQVIESLSKGVSLGKNNWRQKTNEMWGVTTVGTSENQDKTIVDMCYLEYKLGAPYNYNYLNIKTRKKFYCSHLIYAKYLDRYCIDLNTSAYTYQAIHPLELVNTTKTCALYYHKN